MHTTDGVGRTAFRYICKQVDGHTQNSTGFFDETHRNWNVISLPSPKNNNQNSVKYTLLTHLLK